MELRQDCRSNKKDGGDQGPGVADTDPPHEVDDGESPADGDVHAPDAGTAYEKVTHRIQQAHHQQKRNAEADHPAIRNRTGEHDRADLVGNRGKGVSRLDDRGFRLA